jgi:hypothetical protein
VPRKRPGKLIREKGKRFLARLKEYKIQIFGDLLSGLFCVVVLSNFSHNQNIAKGHTIILARIGKEWLSKWSWLFFAVK